MVAQALSERPNECCGLLAGVVDGNTGNVSRRYPLVNETASPVEYLAEPTSLFAAHKDMRERGLEVLAIYHSHPMSPPVPSQKDLALYYWPGTACVIVSLAGATPEVRVWWLGEADYREAEWEIKEETNHRVTEGTEEENTEEDNNK
jgi:[CysO sulfur-carrier protein]-S-L-cysteine hydrolase